VGLRDKGKSRSCMFLRDTYIGINDMTVQSQSHLASLLFWTKVHSSFSVHVWYSPCWYSIHRRHLQHGVWISCARK